MLFSKLRIVLSISVLTLVACGGGASTPAASTTAVAQPEAEAALPAAETLLERSIEVTGGEAAYQAVTSFKMTGTFELPAQHIVGALTVQGATGARLVMQVEIPGMGTERSGSDGTTVWSMSAMTGARLLEGPERDRTLRDADLLKDLNWKTYYKSATTTGEEELDGKAVYLVNMVDNFDVVETRYYEKDSGLLVRQSGTVQTQMGEMQSDTRLKNYTTLGGLIVPSIMEIKVMGMTQLLTTKSIEVNIATDETTFALPEEIQKLVAAKTK